MNICVISTASLQTPPTAYGGMEIESYLLTKGLEELGYHVTLVAKLGSYWPNGGLIRVDDEKQIPYRVSPSGYHAIIDMSHDKTLSHAHKGENLPIIEQYQVMSMTGEGYNPVLISRGQRDGKFGGKDWPIIYQHINLSAYPLYTGEREPYFFFMGQIIEEKRVDWSIRVALETGSPIKVRGPWWGDGKYSELLRNTAKGHPEIDLGDNVGGEEKINLISHARAMLHFPGAKGFCEAGSIVTLECLACGTVPILSRNGVHEEYVRNGENGFIVDSPEEAIDLIKHSAIDEISPEVCRKSVEWAGYLDMAKQYDVLIAKTVRGDRW